MRCFILLEKRIKFKNVEKYIEELTYIIKEKNTFDEIREITKKIENQVY